MRRLALACLVALASGPGAAQAQEPPPPARAIDVQAGLRALVSRQSRDGSWGGANQLAITGMSGLALLASGSTPERGPHAEPLRRAIEFVLSCQDNDRPNRWAYVHPSSGYSAIHNHGYALLFLTQAYGEGGPLDERLRLSITQGIKATVHSQYPNGGFGYFLYLNVLRQHEDMWRWDEASTTISQIQALRGARNAGFTIERDALRRAADYVARSQHDTGGFVYSIYPSPQNPRVSFIEGSNQPTFAITAAATAVLHALGTYDGPTVDRGVDYLEAFLPPTRRATPFFYYAHYYAAQVMHMLGGARGQRWIAAVHAELAARQLQDGMWPADPEDTLATTDSALLNTAWSLQVALIESGSLPIHER